MKRNKSFEFMAWAFDELEDDEVYYSLVAEILYHTEAYFRRPKEEVLNDLAIKLSRGAREHGEPIYSSADVYKNLEEEWIDLLGWLMIGVWNSQQKEEACPNKKLLE